MCGRCRKVFNAFQSLTRLEESEDLQSESSPSAVAEVTSDDIPEAFSAIDITTALVADPLFSREEPLTLPAAFSASEALQQVPLQSSALPGEPISVWPRHVSAREAAPAEPAIDLAGDQPSLRHLIVW